MFVGCEKMLKAMVFIDFENFDIAKYHYYKNFSENSTVAGPTNFDSVEEKPCIYNPRLDFNFLPKNIVSLLSQPHALVKTLLFAPKPDDFLMQDTRRQSTYNWITGMKNQNYFTVIEGRHVARPVAGFTYQTMDINNPKSFFVEEKGTDVNLAAHVVSKGLHNAFDTAVIVSGDTDYIPVMDIMNTIGKSVVVVGVDGQNLFPFKHHSDAQIILDDVFFQTCLRA